MLFSTLAAELGRRRRARQRDRPRRGRDAADAADPGRRRRGTRPTPTSRSCAAGRSPTSSSAPPCSSPPTRRATSPAPRCSSTAAGPPPTAATTRRALTHRRTGEGSSQHDDLGKSRCADARHGSSPDEGSNVGRRGRDRHRRARRVHPRAGAHPERLRPGAWAERGAGRRARRGADARVRLGAAGRPRRRRAAQRDRHDRRRPPGTDAAVRGPHRRRHRGRPADVDASTRSAPSCATAGSTGAARPT